MKETKTVRAEDKGEIMYKVNLNVGMGWNVAGMQFNNDGQIVEISFWREVPAQAGKSKLEPEERVLTPNSAP